MRECAGCGELRGADIVLVGNPNVGKSLLFNHLCGLGAIVSNYPGTTVEILEGDTFIGKRKVRVADLPGLYSLTGGSDEERAALAYLQKTRPQAVINIVDATLLERNLFLSLSLRSLGLPLVVALNFWEEAEAKGARIDEGALAAQLGCPVVKINALHGRGVEELVRAALKCRRRKARGRPNASALHAEARRIARSVVTRIPAKRGRKWGEVFDELTTNPISGSLTLLLVLGALFGALFLVGGGLSRIIGDAFERYAEPVLTALIAPVPHEAAREALRWALVDGVNAGLQIAVPYVLVFYFVIAFLEDSGYLPRMALLLDRVFHLLGLHGKAIIPMMLGFGCSVPAVISTRILPSARERIITAVLIVLIPCSARTAVILGAAGTFLGWQWALAIYAVVLLLILAVGFILGRALPGRPTGLIMELPPYRIPSAKNVFAKTWLRLKHFLLDALPLVVLGSGVLGGLRALGLLEPALRPFEPIISGWLGLPPAAGITLLFGVLRKELALELLAVVGGSTDLSLFMTPAQLFVFSLVTTIYIPCIATIAILRREFGLKGALAIALSTIVLAVLIGGIAARI
ncbi:MAG: ferrous iron transporter B [Candidatus Micrarchaeia archaeon]